MPAFLPLIEWIVSLVVTEINAIAGGATPTVPLPPAPATPPTTPATK